MKHIVITGGHLTPALAVTAKMHKRGWRITYVGRKHALEGDAAISQEYRIISQSGITFKTLITGKLQRAFSWHTIGSLLKIPIGFMQSLQWLLQDRPDVILSFGGYIALPIVMIGKLLKIPLVTHEQTLAPGLTNKLLGFVVDKVCISWEQTRNFFPLSKVVFTGNPIRQEIFEIRNHFDLPKDRPLIYITGGNLGSHVINRAVAEILNELLTFATVIHQCGNSKQYNDYWSLLQLRNALPEKFQRYYLPLEYVDADYIGWVWKNADLVVGRSGANTVAELIACEKASILIPLPHAGKDEQRANAAFLQSAHAALVLEQASLDADVFLRMVKQALIEKKNMEVALSQLHKKMPTDSAKRIVGVVESVA